MNMFLSLGMGLLGLLAGCFLPAAARKTIAYKYAGVEKNLSETKNMQVLLKFGSMIFSAAGCALITYYSKSPFFTVFLCLLWVMAALIAVIDLKVHKIPNELVLIVSILGIAFQFSCYGKTGIITAFLSMAAVMAAFLLLAGSMGFYMIGAGDVKLAGAMGLSLGYPHILQGLIGMSVLMLLYCAFGILMRKLTLKSMLPFAPFMMAGMSAAILAILWGY